MAWHQGGAVTPVPVPGCRVLNGRTTQFIIHKYIYTIQYTQYKIHNRVYIISIQHTQVCMCSCVYTNIGTHEHIHNSTYTISHTQPSRRAWILAAVRPQPGRSLPVSVGGGHKLLLFVYDCTGISMFIKCAILRQKVLTFHHGCGTMILPRNGGP